MFKKNLLLVSLLTVNSTIVLADVTSDSSCKLNKADEHSKKSKKHQDLTALIDMLFNKDDMLKMFNKSFDQVIKFMPVNQTKKSEDLTKGMSNKLAEKMSSDSFKNQFIKIYDNNFSSEEVSDLVNFYNSKTGKKLIEKMPEIAVESGKVTAEMMQEIMTDIFASLQEENCEDCKQDAKKSDEKSVAKD